jgi:hypothetical protein
MAPQDFSAKTKWEGPKMPLIINPDQRCSPAYLASAQPGSSPSRSKDASAASSSPNRLGASPGAAGRPGGQAQLTDLGKDLLKPHCEGVAPLPWRRANEKSANLVGASGTKIRVKMSAPAGSLPPPTTSCSAYVPCFPRVVHILQKRPQTLSTKCSRSTEVAVAYEERLARCQ